MLVEVRVQSLDLDKTTNHPVVVLQEVEGSRVLPIWIGPSEASAIATHLARLPVSRPFTHDLLVSVLGGLGGTVRKVLITRVVEGTYFAELVLQTDGQIITVDARPSDSIAVALRVDARIFADDALLDDHEIQILGSADVGEEQGGPDEDAEGSSPMDADELKEYLKRLHPEDFGRFNP